MNGLLKRKTLTPAEEAENKSMIAEIKARRSPVQLGREWRVVCDHDNPSSRGEYPHRAVGTEQDREGHYVKLRFSEHFVGTTEKGRKERKTDKTKSMWIPHWLLREFKV
jgi:hypothetical protein